MFNPRTITAPLGAKVSFYVTSPDVVHGFFRLAGLHRRRYVLDVVYRHAGRCG